MYNNYNNPYLNNYYSYQGGVPSTNYNNPTPTYNNQNTMNSLVQQSQPQYPMTPLTFVNGIEGAKGYIIPINTTIYLRDSDSDKLFIKSCDNQGKLTMKSYRMVELDENGNEKVEPKPISEIPLDNFITKEYMKSFETKLDERFNKLHSRIDNFSNRKPITREER